MSPDWVDYFKLLAVLGVVLAMAWATTRFLVPALHARGGKADGPIRLRATFPLEPKKTLYLVDVGGRTLCVGSTDSGLSVLATFEQGELP
jgi:flagellar protein FliO/FliZ